MRYANGALNGSPQSNPDCPRPSFRPFDHDSRKFRNRSNSKDMKMIESAEKSAARRAARGLLTRVPAKTSQKTAQMSRGLLTW